MKRAHTLRALATIAVITFATRSASAQTAAQPAAAATAPSASAMPWAALPTGTYQVRLALPEREMPGTVTIRDSSGAPAAIFLAGGDPEPHPMKVTVKGTELFLNAMAPAGAVELVLLRQGDEISGRWAYGEGRGTLKGVVAK
jgi:hypothetical protein